MRKHILYFLLIGLILLPVLARAKHITTTVSPTTDTTKISEYNFGWWPCPWWWPNCPWGNTTTTTVGPTTTTVSPTTTTVGPTTTTVGPTTTTVGPTTTTTISAEYDFQMGYYQCAPLSTVTEVTPNILILLDNSGSMNFMAYGFESGDYQPNNFDPNTNYYGYFDTTITYSYSDGVFKRDATYTSGHWDGNFLNWLTMRRVDIARKVLVGGDASVRDGSGSSTLYGEDSVQNSRRYIKFYEHVSQYTPLDHDYYFFRLESDGTFIVYEIEDQSQFDFSADFSYICDGNSQRDWYFHDYLFDRQSDKSDNSYDIEKIKPSENPPPECDDADYDIVTHGDYVATYNVRVEKDESTEPDLFIDGNIVGVLQRVGDRARFGLEFYNNDNGGKIESYVGGNLTDLISDIEDKGCDTWTPLAESFYEGVRYYRQDSPYYSSGDYTVSQSNDPFYYQDEGRYVECGKNFVLLITDGESTMDLNIPSAYRDYDNDGNDPGSYPDNGSDYLDDVALWAHANDMRPDDEYPELPGDQVITLYTVFAFGTGSQLLKDAAKNGGFIDINDNGEPDLDKEWDKDGNGVPDNYLEAPDGNQLESKIIVAITDILQRAASGTAVSILSTSSEGEGSLFQAFFKPVVFDNLRKIDWVGYLNALWVDAYGNIREDTVPDHALVYADDKIIKFIVDEGSGDTYIERYHDTDPCDGMPDSETPYETVLVSELKPQWEAGEILAKRDASTRTIYTFVDMDDDGIKDEGEFIEFKDSNASTLHPFLDIDPDTPEEAANIINYIRGESFTGYRDRKITIGETEYVWKLGDIVYSTPTVVGKPMEMYNQYYSDHTYGEFFTKWKNRSVTVYVGANDGMLHAFKVGTYHEGDNDTTPEEEHGWYSDSEYSQTTDTLGEELWAYIPYNLLPHLKWLKEFDYPHVYYVDLKPKVTDARIFTDDTNHPNGWGTILIGGMRLGGGANMPITLTKDFGSGDETRTFRSAYFCLDITVPDDPELLWEVTHEDLDFTTSYPAIVRLAGDSDPDTVGSWYAIFGSGPNSCDGGMDHDGYVFVVDLTTGEFLKKFTTDESSAFMATPITLDVNLNYSVDVIYIGETYEQGVNVRGKMYRISTRNDPDPSVWSYQTDVNNWVMTTLFSSTTPITASATASIDEEDNIWVYFGTGKYYSNEDKSDTTIQYFYGVKDPCPYGSCTAADEVALADLYNSTDIDIVMETDGDVSIEGVAGVSGWDELVNLIQSPTSSYKGWYINLATGGERLLTRPSILGGVIIFAPFTPDDDVCKCGGKGTLYALYYETGTAYYEPILGTEESEEYGDGKEVCLKKVDLGQGLTTEIGMHVGRKAECTGFIQQGTGVIKQVEVAPALGIRSGIVGWKQY